MAARQKTKRGKPQLVVVVASGPHATGKTTLLHAIADILERQGEYVDVVPQFQSLLFRVWSQGKLASAPPVIPTFMELAESGSLPWFQTQLPEALSFAVEDAANRFADSGSSRAVFLVERWFPDIIAATRLVLPQAQDAPTRDVVRELCYSRHEQMLAMLNDKFDLVAFVSAFIPLGACDKFYQYGGDASSVHYAEQFEGLCLDEWCRVTGNLPTVTATCADLSTRVFNVLTAISNARRQHGESARADRA